MKSHRTIWFLTGLVAVTACVIVFVREATAPAREPSTGFGRVLSGQEADRLVDTMLACLDRDPQMRGDKTRRVVTAVAALAESGARDTAETQYALGLRLAAEAASRRAPASSARAEQAYAKAIALRPEWSWPHNSLGLLHQSSERYAEAEQAFRDAIELAPEWSRPHNDLAVLFRVAGHLEEATEEALLALALDPDGVATHNNYGNLLVELGRFDEAREAYAKAISIEPDHAAPYYNLACLASLQGDRDEALAYLNCAVVLDEEFRVQGRTDADFDGIRDDPKFRELIHGEE